MSILGPPPISAVQLARRIASESDLTWDRSQRSIKNCLYKLGSHFGRVFCHRKGLPPETKVHEWLLDMVWTNQQGMRLAVESELSRDNRHRLDDFEKLMYVKSPLKLFIYKATKSPDDRDKCHASLAEYMQDLSQNIEGEEYLLMEVKDGQAHFFRYSVPNSGSVTNVAFAPLELKQGSSA